MVGSVVVAVGVADDGQTAEVVLAAEHGTEHVLLGGVPEDEAVAEQVLATAVNAELELHLPVGHGHWLELLEQLFDALGATKPLLFGLSMQHMFDRKSKSGFRIFKRIRKCDSLAIIFWADFTTQKGHSINSNQSA